MAKFADSTFVAALRKALPETTMAFDGDEGFAESKAAWNILTQYTPLGIVQPESADEVGVVLKLAAEHGVDQIAVRAGGHSFEGLSLGGKDSAALVVDVIKLDSIESDPEAGTLTAGGGALLGKVYLHAWRHGEQMIPGGSCLSVGLGGQIQAGGYGHYARTYGVLTDRVLEFEVVTPDGTIRRVGEAEHPDLFFALRGSGSGSFGVITKIVLRTNPAPRAVADFTVRWELDRFDIPDLLKQIQKASLSAPKTFNPMVVVWLGVLEVSGSILTDDPQERDAVWAGFLDQLPTPSHTRFEAVAFIESVRKLGLSQTSAPWYEDMDSVRREGAEHLRYMKIKAGFMPEPMSDDFLDRFGRFATTQPSRGVRVQILALDPEEKPEHDTTSIKVRSCPWLMGMSVWLEASEYNGAEGATLAGVERRPWLDEAYELFHPYTRGGYIGDDDLDEAKDGRDIYESYYGQHLPRLIQVKQKYDPENRFHHPLSVPVREIS